MTVKELKKAIKDILDDFVVYTSVSCYQACYQDGSEGVA